MSPFMHTAACMDENAEKSFKSTGNFLIEDLALSSVLTVNCSLTASHC